MKGRQMGSVMPPPIDQTDGRCGGAERPVQWHQPLTVSDAAKQDDVSRLSAVVVADLGTDDQRWFTPDGYTGVALCVLDSIYSTGNQYSSVVKMISRYRQARRYEAGDPEFDGPVDLLAAADRWGGTDGFVSRTRSRWRVSTKPDAPFKAVAALGAARVLDQAGLSTVADVREARTDHSKQEQSVVKKEWVSLPGQRSGLTWTYFLMLAGVPGVKADRRIVRYVSRALGHQVGVVEAASLVAAVAAVAAVADRRGLSQTKLDHAIWRKESGRDVFSDGDRTRLG